MVESSLKATTRGNLYERSPGRVSGESTGVVESMRACNIRQAEAADLEKVIELDANITGLRKRENWKQLLHRFGAQNRNGFFLIAEDGERFLGFIIGEVRAWEFGSPPCGWVFAIGVHPESRTERIGTCLFEEICERFRRSGIFIVRTMLAREDHLNMSFFRSQGMRGGPFIQLEKKLDDPAAVRPTGNPS